jgi:hypothetical protein
MRKAAQRAFVTANAIVCGSPAHPRSMHGLHMSTLSLPAMSPEFSLDEFVRLRKWTPGPFGLPGGEENCYILWLRTRRAGAHPKRCIEQISTGLMERYEASL